MADTLLLHNARIRTMDPVAADAEWVLVRDGRIVALGRDNPPDAARRIDAGGRLVLPGFQDAHIHLLNGGVDLVETAQLYDCTTLAEIQSAVAHHAARWSGPVVWGAGWQNGFFGDHNLTHKVLDAVVPDRPCLIYDSNFHNACINSVALAMAGITKATSDPLNGQYVRDASGQPTGMLHEDAIYRVLEDLPKTTEETLQDGLVAEQAHANRHGITGVLDAQISEHHRRIYAWGEAEGKLTLRVAGTMHVTADETVADALSRLKDWRARHGSDLFHLHSAKLFLDGGFENRTAATL